MYSLLECKDLQVSCYPVTSYSFSNSSYGVCYRGYSGLKLVFNYSTVIECSRIRRVRDALLQFEYTKYLDVPHKVCLKDEREKFLALFTEKFHKVFDGKWIVMKFLYCGKGYKVNNYMPDRMSNWSFSKAYSKEIDDLVTSTLKELGY